MKSRYYAFALAAPLALAACGDGAPQNSAETNLTLVDDFNAADPLADDTLLLNEGDFDAGTNLTDPFNDSVTLDNASNGF